MNATDYHRNLKRNSNSEVHSICNCYFYLNHLKLGMKKLFGVNSHYVSVSVFNSVSCWAFQSVVILKQTY
jgi:hypothetical protein